MVWSREILRNSPMAVRLCKSALNAVEDGHAGLQARRCSYYLLVSIERLVVWMGSNLFSFRFPQEFAGNATLLFYNSEEGQEGKTAFLEGRPPDFSRFPRLP